MQQFSVLLVSLLSFIAIGCGGQPTVSSVTMTDAQRAELLAALEKLDETLEQHAPEIFKQFAPPASDDDIKELRSGLGGVDRPFLELWFRWHNGGQNGVVGLLPLGDALSIQEALADRAMNQSISMMHHSRRRDIKLLDDGAGDGYFLNLSSNPPRVYYEMLEDPAQTDYGTLAEFVDFIEQVHAAKITTVDDRGFVDFDWDAYSKLETKHLASLQAGQ